MTASSIPPEPGTLHLIKSPFPSTVPDIETLLFVGDPTGLPVHKIIPAKGVTLPSSPIRADLPNRPFSLRVLHINDMHGHISKFNTRGNRPIFSKVVGRMEELTQQRQNNPNAAVICLSAGDDSVGAVFDELLGDDSESFQLHAGYRLYSAAGFQAVTLGNHDLDLGTQLLAKSIQHDAKFPVLSANLVGSRWLNGLYYPAALLLVKGVRVGIIGVTTPAAIKPQVDDTGLHLVNPIQVVHNLLPAMRPLCDVIIILSHLGYSLESNSAAVAEAGDVELARSLPPNSVQLIVGGHTHHVLNEQGLSAKNIINDVPIVQAGSLGRFLGEVDITLQYSAAVTNVRLTPVVDLPVAEEFEQTQVQPLVEMARPLFGRVLGHVDTHPDLTTDVVRNWFAVGESALANFISDAMVTRCRANGHNVDLAVVDASCMRCGLPVGGPLTFGDWFNIMPFADTINICWITGEQLKFILFDNARRADRPGEPHCERGFLQFSRQLRYTLYLGQHRSESCAEEITINEIPLNDQLDRSFLVACSNFMRKAATPWERWAAQHFKMPNPKAWPTLDTHLFLRDEMIAYIRDNGGVTAEGGAQRDNRLQVIWKNCPITGEKMYVNNT